MEVLEELIEGDVAGDPMGQRSNWCRRSTHSLSADLKDSGIAACPNSVGKTLKDMNISLRCCRKSISETNHPDRDQQFQIIAATRKRFADHGHPIISIDTKKRELVGNFSNKGRCYRRQATETLVHDFRSDAIGVAIPYGVYDVLNNRAMVIVGTSYDTPEFAVDSVRIWLEQEGFAHYGTIRELLILADSGGSNGASPRMWKHELYHRICRELGIGITVCHYPSGASKWNPVEHRLFGPLTRNWAGEPLRSYEVILGFINSTHTKTGLTVRGALNDKVYERGRKVCQSAMRALPISFGQQLPRWNYTIEARNTA